jgi:hypothetical protein
MNSAFQGSIKKYLGFDQARNHGDIVIVVEHHSSADFLF